MNYSNPFDKYKHMSKMTFCISILFSYSVIMTLNKNEKTFCKKDIYSQVIGQFLLYFILIYAIKCEFIVNDFKSSENY